MRSLLFSLLVVNCVYGGIGLWSAQAPSARSWPVPPLAAPSVRLLSEVLPVVEIREPDDRLESREGAIAAPAGANACQTFGPFADRDAADAMRSRLEEGGIESTVIEEASSSLPLLVYVGPVESARRAAEIRAELLARDIECQVIRSGPLTHALSVGVFRRTELAERQSERVAAYGYETRITPWGNAVAYRVVAQASAPGDAESCAAIAPPQRFL
jgi:hypothetical protein